MKPKIKFLLKNIFILFGIFIVFMVLIPWMFNQNSDIFMYSCLFIFSGIILIIFAIIFEKVYEIFKNKIE